MVQDVTSGTPGGGRWDVLALELQALRRTTGDVSYAEIARRITERRLADGASPHAARVARTTVYDAFRTGRARVNVALVREIAEALGGSADDVTGWVARCHDAEPVPPTAASGPAEQVAPAAEPEVPARPDPLAAPAAPAAVVAHHPVLRPSTRQVVLLLLACLVVNLLGRGFVEILDLPIHLDMVGTAISAVALGPWHGALVGGASNVVGVAESGPVSLPFAIVNIAGALAWGYGVRRFGMGRTLPRYFLLNIIVALICTLIAVPILVLVYGGSAGHGQDVITDSFMTLTQTLVVSVGLSNLLVSVGDKVMSGFVALVVVSALPPALRAGLRLALVTSAPVDQPLPARQPVGALADPTADPTADATADAPADGSR